MKKLIFAVTVAFMLVAGSAFAATLNMICETLVANVGPHITSEHDFTIEVDDADGETVLGWTDFLSNQFFTDEVGGYDPRDGGAFANNEQVYPNGVYTSATTAFDGNIAGTTMWFRGQANADGPLFPNIFNVGLLQLTYDKVTEKGTMAFGPNMALSETYSFRLAPSSITILKPNGGETLYRGLPYSITWDSQGVTGTVKIELYKGGALVKQLEAAAANDGEYSYTPALSLASGNDYQIKISKGAVSGSSDADFTIAEAPPTLIVTFPNGEDALTKGGNHTITWISISNTGTIQIDLYKGDTLIQQLDAGTVDDGEYPFSPTDALEDGTNYRIRITSNDDNTVWDRSNKTFSIYAFPSGPWTGSGIGSEGRITFELEFSTDGTVTGTITEVGADEDPEQVTGTYIGNDDEVTIQLDEGAPNNTQWDFTGTLNSTKSPTSVTGEITGGPGGGEDFSLRLSLDEVIDAPKCIGKKLKTSAKLCKAYMRVYAKHMKKPNSDLRNSLGKAEWKFLKGWDKAEKKAQRNDTDCSTAADSAVEDNIFDSLENIYNQINDGINQNDKDSLKYGSRLVKTVGKKCKSLFKAEYKNAKKPDEEKKTARLIKADEKFEKRWVKYTAKANKKQVIYTGPDMDEVNEMIASLIYDILEDMGI